MGKDVKIAKLEAARIVDRAEASSQNTKYEKLKQEFQIIKEFETEKKDEEIARMQKHAKDELQAKDIRIAKLEAALIVAEAEAHSHSEMHRKMQKECAAAKAPSLEKDKKIATLRDELHAKDLKIAKLEAAVIIAEAEASQQRAVHEDQNNHAQGGEEAALVVVD